MLCGYYIQYSPTSCILFYIIIYIGTIYCGCSASSARRPFAPPLSCVHIYPYPLHLVWYYILYLPYLLPLYLVRPSPVPPHPLTTYCILAHLIWRIKYPYTPHWSTLISHKVILYPQYAQPPPSCTAPVSPMHSAQPATRRERAAVSAFWVGSVKVHWPTPV